MILQNFAVIFLLAFITIVIFLYSCEKDMAFANEIIKRDAAGNIEDIIINESK